MALSPYRVAPVPHALGRAFVASHHYAGGAPNTSVFCHGLLLNEELVGHTGAIYRATNWTYLGTTAPGRRWATPDGRQVTGKSTVNRTKAEMLALGYRQLPPSVKHKYVMVLR